MGDVITAIVAVLVPMGGWVLAIQAKVSSQSIQLEAQKELILSKLDEIGRRLGRIERGMNGQLGSSTWSKEYDDEDLD